MNRVKFYSEFDMASGWYLEKVIERINDNSLEKEWDLEDVIEFYNILKYMQVKRCSEFLEEKTNVDSKSYIKLINAKIGKYLNINKSDIVSKHDEIYFAGTEDFLELIEKYGVYKSISSSQFEIFLDKENIPLYMVLKHKKIVDYFDCIIKEKIMKDAYHAETILSKFLDDTDIYLPASLKESEMLTLIDSYIDIDSERVHINVLRTIVNFPSGIGLNITDKIRLHAKRKEKEESEKLFSQGTGYESSVSISYEKDLDEAIKIDCEGKATKISIIVNRDWIEENKDFPTLWNNFIYLFGIVDSNARVTMVSKEHENSALSLAFMQTGSHLYRKSFVFDSKEMLANAMAYSYIQVLKAIDIRIEDMIEWFFHEYLSYEFSINDFIVRMPTDVASYFEKCRTILPEIDRVFKQYNALIEDNEIDQELIQISSSSIKINEVKSFLKHKYVYPTGDWFKTASFLLFSDQSGIFYIPQKEERNRNFLDLIVRDNVKKQDFQDYQLRDMNWLFENDLIIENTEGFIKISDAEVIFILKQLYYEEVLSYFHYGGKFKKVIDAFERKQIVSFGSSLLTKNEQDYMNFYLNKSKFTNGYDIRNRYLHGTNVNDEKQYQSDYHAILKLMIIIVLKINDDLCLKYVNE